VPPGLQIQEHPKDQQHIQIIPNKNNHLHSFTVGDVFLFLGVFVTGSGTIQAQALKLRTGDGRAFMTFS
jgi:hypothetical protein